METHTKILPEWAMTQIGGHQQVVILMLVCCSHTCCSMLSLATEFSL